MPFSLTALEVLLCNDNELTSLSLPAGTALTTLDCQFNQLKNLDASASTGLATLDCRGNQLTSLSLPAGSALTELYCVSNQLQNLNASASTGLATLWCNNNQLTSLSLPAGTALTELTCQNNQLKNLDVSASTGLATLDCGSNQLTSLTLPAGAALTKLYCSKNQLQSLTLGSHPALTELTASDNQLSSVDLTGTPNLQQLNLAFNKLTSLNLSGLSALHTLLVHRNPLTRLDVTGIHSLATFYFPYNAYSGVTLPDGSTFPYTLTLTDHNDSAGIGYLMQGNVFYILAGDAPPYTPIDFTGLSGMTLLNQVSPTTIEVELTGNAAATVLWHKYGAEAAGNMLAAPSTLYADEAFTILAVGDNQSLAPLGDPSDPDFPTETRYIPISVTANPTAAFALDADGDYTAEMTLPAGDYTLSATFQLQEWTGTAWANVTGETDTKTLPITVVARGAETTAGSPQTGDAANGGLWATLGLGALCLLCLALYGRRRHSARG